LGLVSTAFTSALIIGSLGNLLNEHDSKSITQFYLRDVKCICVLLIALLLQLFSTRFNSCIKRWANNCVFLKTKEVECCRFKTVV